MKLFWRSYKLFTALALILVFTVTTACTNVTERPSGASAGANSAAYQQLERGNTAVGQNFGNWVVQASKGLVADAYVRGNDKLGVVIARDVRPNEVKPLAKSLVQGFHRNFPNRDVSVLMYAPDKQLIMTAQYNELSKQVEYKAA